MKPITTNSAVEFLVALLLAASVIAIVAKRLRLPYTVALVESATGCDAISHRIGKARRFLRQVQLIQLAVCHMQHKGERKE